MGADIEYINKEVPYLEVPCSGEPLGAYTALSAVPGACSFPDAPCLVMKALDRRGSLYSASLLLMLSLAPNPARATKKP